MAAGKQDRGRSTDEPRVLRELRELKGDVQSLLQTARGFFFYRVALDPANPHRGRVLLVSPSITEVFGITDRYDFDSWFKGLHPEDMPRIMEAHHHSLTTGVAFDQIARWYHKPRGEWVWVRSMSQPVFNTQGVATHFNGMCIDITDQKRAETRMLESQTTLNAVVDSTSDFVWSVDPKTFGLLTFNRALSDHLARHYRLCIKVGMRPEALGAEPAAARTWRKLYRRALKEGPYSTEYTSDAPTTVLQLSLNVLKRDGRAFAVSVFAKDITDLKAAETEQRRLAAALLKAEQDERRRIAYILHEDIQQHLVAMQYKVSELKEAHAKGRTASTADWLLRELGQTVRLTRELTGRVHPPILDGFGLVPVLEWLATDAKERFGLAVDIVVARPPKPIAAESLMFVFDAVRELLLNVVKHADVRSAHIKVGVAGKRALTISVTDRGTGFGVEQTGNSKFGLRSIRERARVLGVRFDVSGEPQKGTRATLTLPVL